MCIPKRHERFIKALNVNCWVFFPKTMILIGVKRLSINIYYKKVCGNLIEKIVS